MDILLAEDLLLVLLDGAKGTMIRDTLRRGPRNGPGDLEIGFGLLADLALLGAVEEHQTAEYRNKTLRVVPEVQLHDPVLLRSVEVIREEVRYPVQYASRLGEELCEQLCQRLAARGVLRREDDQRLGVFRRTRWPITNTVPHDDLRRELTRVVVEGGEPDDHTHALLALLHAARLTHKVVDRSELSRRQVHKRAAAITERPWVGSWVAECLRAATRTQGSNDYAPPP